MKVFVNDVAKCNGCYACQIVCKDEHCGNDWTPYAKPQPETGQFWGKLNEYVRGQVPKVKMSYVFVPCQHCKDAPCIEACPVDSALYTRDDELVIIDAAICTGCQNCMDACPYGAIYYNAQLGIAQKCTGCTHLIDKGWTDTRCSDACPTEALIFGEESDIDLTGTEILYPDYGLTTRVHYKNLPKRFIAGLVYNSSEREVVTGATCTLTSSTGTTYTETTDEFGDFWFNGLDEDVYSLKIESGGVTYTQEDISTQEADINLGDIALV
jgi:Fe-S-cluster-containing dehydrogenase component